MDLRYYIRVLRLRWRLVALCVVAAIITASVVTYTSVPKYTASVQLFVAARDQGTAAGAYQGGLFSQQQVKSYIRLAGSRPVMTGVITELRLRTTPGTLAKEIKATLPTDTVIVVISVTDPSPIQAQAIANATGIEFAALVTALEKPDATAASPVKVSVFQPADLPTSQSSPNTKINIGLALFAGLIVGLAAAILRSRLDTSVRTSDDLTRVTGMPTLGVIASDRDAAGRPLLLHANPRSDRAEAFRQLRTNLRFVDVDRRPRSIVIASALPGEGKTTTAANLAITLAEAGLRVVLVNADLRRPGLGLYMGIEESVGLTSVLIGSAELADAVQELGNGLLRVLPSGPLPPNPSELLGSIGMRQVIQGLERDNDIVLLDSPPLLTVTDASVLSATAGGVIVVVRSGKTKLGELKQALAGLQTVGAHILGGVVNMAPRNGSNAQRYSHRYGDDYSKRSRRHVEAVPMEPGAVQVVPPQADEVRPSAAVARLETAD